MVTNRGTWLILGALHVCNLYGLTTHDLQKRCNERKTKDPLELYRCDSHGYYFDRGGKRMFETSYNRYRRGTFNLRRGHVWQDRSICKRECRKICKKQYCTRLEQPATTCPVDAIEHEHYAGNQGLTRWPSSPGPEKNARSGTSAFPYVATPIWLRDTSGAIGYSTPTSWQGFQ